MKKYLVLFLFLFTVSLGNAQQLEQLVSLEYDKVPLGEVLQDISNRYEVYFSYSADFIPINQPVSISVQNYPLRVVLDELFEASPIVYRFIAGQVVLRIDHDKQKRLDALAMQRRKRVLRPQQKTVKPLPLRKQEVKEGGNRVIDIPVRWIEPMQSNTEKEEEDGYNIRIGLFSFFKEKPPGYENEVSDLSINILWGESSNINGMEVGGLLNKTHHHVKGVQVAGLGNIVGEDVVGTQVSLLGNVVGGSVNGVQSALGFNLVGKDVGGVQVAGIFNYNYGQADALQAAGLFNNSRGNAKWQIASLFNRADTVKRGQISLVNIGKRVNGIQVGVINVSDTTNGVGIGLLNINKRGYNRFEVSAGDALHFNVAFKPGVAAFYNIFHLGTAWNRVVEKQDGAILSWGLGYGMGSSIRLGRKAHLNIEALATHINEDRSWTGKLNLLGQFRASLEMELGRGVSCFFGPTAYLMSSHLRDEETGTKGSVIAPEKVLWELTRGITNQKAWIGFNAGILF